MFKINKEFVTGAILGFIAGVASRRVIEELGPSLKPVAKEAIKAARATQAKVREGLGYLFETFSDLSAEATSDLDLEMLKTRKPRKTKSAPAAQTFDEAPATEEAEESAAV